MIKQQLNCNSDHTGNERHLRWKEIKKESKCVRGESSAGGLVESFYHWTAASAPLASKSRGGGSGWFQLIAPVPNSTGLLKPTLLHCLFFFFLSVYLSVPKVPLYSFIPDPHYPFSCP